MNKKFYFLLFFLCFWSLNGFAQTVDESNGNITGFNRIITGSSDWMDVQIAGSSGSFKIHDKTNGSNWVRWDAGSSYTEFLKDVQINSDLYVDGELDVGNDRNVGSASHGLNIAKDYNTNIQLTHDTWSGSHGMLFNAYRSATDVTGRLSTVGDTKYANDAGNYSGGAGAIMFFGNSGQMDFFVSPESTGRGTDVDWGTPKMRIRRNGNIGINTTDPTETLTVNGTAKAEEIIVEEDIGADFVFEDGYDLPELKEIESYIQKQNHLQGIPSAEEMKKNGVKVGDLQMKLLQKIEELTLHLISQEKKTSRLKTQNEKEIAQLHSIVRQQQEEIEHLKQLIKQD